MREIKFRGLPTCKDNDELDYINFDRDGNFAVGFYEDGYIIGKVADANDEYISPEFWVAVDRNTVGQYTGLHDKNGKEIFEGDIVRYTWDMLSDVNATEKGKKVRISKVFWSDWRVSWAIGKKSCNNDLFRYVRNGNTVEVIGNIYENPDLLEAER